MYTGLHVKYPLFLSDLIQIKFSQKIFEKTQITKIMKIHLVGAELFHANKPDRPKDMTKLIVAFRNSANVPKNDK